MNLSQPASSPFDVRWRLFGIRFRIRPWFWIFALVFGSVASSAMIRDPAAGHLSWSNVLLWVGCTLLSVLTHELGHVVAGRIFGERGDIIISGFGGMATGEYGRLRRPQRIMVAAAGPLAGFLLLAVVILLDNRFWNEKTHALGLPQLDVPCLFERINALYYLLWHWYVVAGRYAFAMLTFMNFFWNVMNLIPILPLDGGRIMLEVLGGLFPRHGTRLALGVTVVVAGFVAVYSGLKLANPELPFPLTEAEAPNFPETWMWLFYAPVTMLLGCGFIALRTLPSLFQRDLGQPAAPN